LTGLILTVFTNPNLFQSAKLFKLPEVAQYFTESFLLLSPELLMS